MKNLLNMNAAPTAQTVSPVDAVTPQANTPVRNSISNLVGQNKPAVFSAALKPGMS